jgi:hypothetical protein
LMHQCTHPTLMLMHERYILIANLIYSLTTARDMCAHIDALLLQFVVSDVTHQPHFYIICPSLRYVHLTPQCAFYASTTFSHLMFISRNVHFTPQCPYYVFCSILSSIQF